MEKDIFKLSSYDFKVPSSLIAQEPLRPRDSSRLLMVNRKGKTIEERSFKDVVHYLDKGDVLVLNDTRVMRARLLAKRESGGRLEVLLVKQRMSVFGKF